MRSRGILLIFILYLGGSLSAQDFHFSQFQHSPLNVNPALTGIYEFGYWGNDLRMIGNYRDQWRSIPSAYVSTPTPFKTNSFSADMKLRNVRYLKKDFIGVGAVFYSDKAGDLDFKTQQVNFSLSYSKLLNYHGDKYLTAGFTGGYSKRSIDYTNAVFDNQWTGTQFDPSRASGESFPGMRYTYPDLSAGMAFSFIPVDKINFTSGFAIMHLNKPRQNFLSSNSGNPQSYRVVLYPTMVFHTNARIPLRNKRFLLPNILYLKQGPAREFNCTSYFQVRPEDKDRLNYQFGLGYRIVGNYQHTPASDALIAAVKFLYNNLSMTFSYDANTSSLKRSTKSIGGFEISIICYERFFNPKRYKDMKARPECPRYDDFKDFPVW
ncbi:MAG: PorP/SprF family type IX secretion system membrane protein [Cytophagaceae bacterium]